jgi:Glycosyl hydrolase family 59
MKSIIVVAAAVLFSLLTAAAGRPAAKPYRRPSSRLTATAAPAFTTGWAPSLAGGGNARYLEDYPPAQQSQILDYLFKPGWLGCARRSGLTISYLGGWNERDNGSHVSWFHALRLALNAGGYPDVQIVAGDGIASPQGVPRQPGCRDHGGTR